MNARREAPLTVEPGVTKRIAAACGGDVRKGHKCGGAFTAAAGRTVLTAEDAAAITQRSAMRYDRDGDEHFDCLSALMNAARLRPDAAMHYLARLIEAGDLVGICRRLLCSASEDIGLPIRRPCR